MSADPHLEPFVFFQTAGEDPAVRVIIQLVTQVVPFLHFLTKAEGRKEFLGLAFQPRKVEQLLEKDRP